LPSTAPGGSGGLDSIGSARRDLGALLLIVPKELAPDKKGQCWITTGTGAEGILTDAVSARICTQQIIPFLKTGTTVRRSPPVSKASRTASATTPGCWSPTSKWPGRSPPRLRRWEAGVRWWHVLGGALLAGAGLAGIPVVRRRRPRRCPRCGKRMHRLDEQRDDDALDPAQRIEERIKSVDYDVWACECGEMLVLPYRSWFSSYHRCPACHHRTAKVSRRVIKQPNYTTKGLARDTTTCKACGATSTKEIVLPKRTQSSSGSSSGAGLRPHHRAGEAASEDRGHRAAVAAARATERQPCAHISRSSCCSPPARPPAAAFL
jgi:uncharacterized protein with PIN domain